MNRCTYVLAGNAANRVPPPSANPPSTVQPPMKDLFINQEKERHRLLMQVMLIIINELLIGINHMLYCF